MRRASRSRPNPRDTTMYRALVLAVLLARVVATPDYCHADPRVRFRHARCDAHHNAIETGIFVPYLPYNPYHSLHDHLWALSHYLSHCTRPHTKRVIYAGKGAIDLAACRKRVDAPRTQLGLWMPCVFALLARHYGIPVADLRAYPKNASWPAVAAAVGCVRQAVLFGVEPAANGVAGYGKTHGFFRGMSWFGADCGGTHARGSCFQFEETTSGIVPLPDVYKASALRAIRDAVYEYLQVERVVSHGKRVNVLVYDRNDTRWRQWTNALPIVERLRMDDALNVRYVRSTPVSFFAQVELYYWADVVIAPHGAAMASTIFMRPGADIVEIFTSCDANVVQNRYMPQTWTGWHPYLLGLHLQYIQCHVTGSGVKREEELDSGLEAFYVVTGKPHMVDVEQAMPVIESAIARQRERVSRGREVRQSYRGVTEAVSIADDLGQSVSGLEWMYGVIGFTCVIVCSFSMVAKRAGRRRKFETD